MAKKHGPNWKKALRAEVAAAIQGKAGTTAPAVVQPGTIASSPVPSPASSLKTPHDANAVVIMSDLRRIGFVAAFLFALLITAAITDHTTDWLNRAADSFANTLN